MKRWLRPLGMLVAIAGGIAFLAYAVSSVRFADFAPYLTLRTALALLAAAILYGCTIPVSAWAWRGLLAALGSRRGLLELNQILLTTQIGKYLPGNVGQHIGRAGMSLSRGIPAAPMVASIAYEMLLLMLAGVLTGVVAGWLSPAGERLLQGRGTTMALVSVIALGCMVLVPVVGRVLPPLMRRFSASTGITAIDLRMGVFPALSSFAAYVACYLLIGIGIALLAASMFPLEQLDLALLVSAFAIAWVAGFVTPGAPAGMGVREGVLILMLGGPLGPAAATALILALRIATMLGDILCLVAGLLLGARQHTNSDTTGGRTVRTNA